jgi:hypothetical protein
MPHIETNFDPFAGPEIAYVLNTTKAQSEIWALAILVAKMLLGL